MPLEHQQFDRHQNGRPTPRERFENALARMHLEFPCVRDAQVEWAAFPSMAAIYCYWQLVQKDMPPTQAVFTQAVALAVGQPQNAAVHARASRAYPSLVRQHHAEVLLRERFRLVIHHEELDHDGVDLLVIDGWFAIGLGLTVDTPSAHTWREVKHRRHRDPPGLPILEVWAEPNAYRVGRFWLHPHALADEVEAFIERERGRRSN